MPKQSRAPQIDPLLDHDALKRATKLTSSAAIERHLTTLGVRCWRGRDGSVFTFITEFTGGPEGAEHSPAPIEF
jgi:hypothetical protein